jgi:heptosyltransferase-3
MGLCSVWPQFHSAKRAAGLKPAGRTDYKCMSHRILVIRGGAIGDFILTLPALKALRGAYPKAHIAILGYKHIAALAENRFYAQAIRSIEYGPMSGFFARDSELSPELASYFSSFDLIISYLYDPDGIFENNLRRCGVRQIVRGPAKVDDSQHATRQLAQPVLELGIPVTDLAAEVYPSREDRDLAAKFLADCARPIVTLHPGSGSEKKNWPLECWIEIGNQLLSWENFAGSIVVISGEADERQTVKLESISKNPRVLFAKNLPLTRLAALFADTIFLGHDSGISQLAAAAGARCILLFGPTDSAVWAPLNKTVAVIRAPSGDLRALRGETVLAACATALAVDVPFTSARR